MDLRKDNVYGQIFQPRGRLQGQTGKRTKEGDVKGSGTANGLKKGRAAFGDITNTEKSNFVATGKVDSLPSYTAGLETGLGSLERVQSTLSCQSSFSEVQAPTPSWLIKRIRFSDCFVPEPEKHTQAWVDIDVNDDDDPLACSTYVNQMFENLRTAEVKKRPSTAYMDNVQDDINSSMRAILVDWLIEVAQEYRLQPETLHLTVSYLDRYLSTIPVQRARLQLVGVACMSIASKYEEIYPPTVGEFCFITDYTYSRVELLETENSILETLSFELTVPTAQAFLPRFLKAAAAGNSVDERLETLAAYLIELSLEEYNMLYFLPSQVAASAVLLSQFLMSSSPTWSLTLEHYTTYTAQDLKKCCTALFAVYSLACTMPDAMTALKEKYDYQSLTAALIRADTLPSWLFHA